RPARTGDRRRWRSHHARAGLPRRRWWQQRHLPTRGSELRDSGITQIELALRGAAAGAALTLFAWLPNRPSDAQTHGRSAWRFSKGKMTVLFGSVPDREPVQHAMLLERIDPELTLSPLTP